MAIGQLRYTAVLKIEGIRIKGSSTENNIEQAFYFGELDGLPIENNLDSPIRIISYSRVIDSIPSTLNSSINVFTSEYGISAPVVSLVATEEMTRLFFGMDSSNGEATLTTDTAADIGSAILYVTYAGTIEAEDILYIGDECIYVFSVSSHTGDEYVLSVRRRNGYKGASAAYSAGKRVYINSIPYFEQRRATLEIYDNDEYNSASDLNYPVHIFNGVIEKVGTNSDSTLIEISMKDILSLLIDIQLPANQELFSPKFYTSETDPSIRTLYGAIYPTDNNNFTNYEFATQRPWKTWKIGDSVYRTSGSYNDLESSYNVNSQDFYVHNGEGTSTDHVVFSKTATWDEVNDLVGKTIFETISFDSDDNEEPNDNAIPITSTISTLFPWYLSYGDVNYSRNPVAIALVLLMSTGNATNHFVNGSFTISTDCLSRNWGGGISMEYFDGPSWEDLIIKSKTKRVDNMNLAYDGQFSLKSVVLKLLRMSDSFCYINKDGKIAVSSFRSFQLDQLESSLLLDENSQNLIYLTAPKCRLIRENDSKGVVATVGGMPGEDTAIINVVNLVGDRRDSIVSSIGVNLDLEYIDRNKAMRNSRVYSTVELQMRNYKHLLNEQNPYLECSVPIKYKTNTGIPGVVVEQGKVPDLTSWVVIRGENEIIGPDGNRIIINDQENWIIFLGRIVEYTLNIANMTYDLKIYLQNWRTGSIPKYVAPTCKIIGYSSSVLDVALTGGEDSDIYRSALDNGFGFKVGDQVRIVDELGKDTWYLHASGGYTTIVSMTTSTITLNDSLAASPMVNSYLRLANKSEYNNTDATNYLAYLPADQRRLWAFFEVNDVWAQ